MDIDGEPTLVGGRGSALGVRAMASDIGTDDLVFVWTLMDADETSEAPARVAAYYNDGAEPDPPLSLTGSHPLEATDGFNLAVPDLGPHRLRLGVVDDDGGSVSDHLSVLIVGDVSCTRSEAAWRRRFGNGRRAPTDPDRLTAYMAVVRRASATFDEANLADIEDAQALFREGGGPDSARSLRQRTLAAWLNFASGGVGWYEDVAGRTFHDIVLDAEALLAAGGPQGQLSRAVQAVDAVNRLHRGGVCDGE